MDRLQRRSTTRALAIVAAACLSLATALAEYGTVEEEQKVADSIRAAMKEASEELGEPGGDLQGDFRWAAYRSANLTIVVYLEPSRRGAADDWEEMQECRTIMPALKHEVTDFRNWNATYTDHGLINWIEDRFRIHFHHAGQTDLEELKREAEVFLMALGRHGVIEDWWSGAMMMCQEAKMKGPDGRWVDLPVASPFEVKPGTELMIDYTEGLLFAGGALTTDVDLHVTVQAVTKTDEGHDIELLISPAGDTDMDPNLELLTLQQGGGGPVSRVRLDNDGDLEPVKLSLGHSDVDWSFLEEQAYLIDVWHGGFGPAEGYTGYKTWAAEIAKRRKWLEEWSQTLEAQLPEQPPGEWDLSVTAEGEWPFRIGIHSEVSFKVEADGTKRLHVFEGRVEGTHLDSGKQVVVRKGECYETEPGGAPGSVETFDPEDVPRWWERDTGARDDEPEPPAGEPEWVFDGSGTWSMDEGSLHMSGTGAYKKRWALLDRDLRDFTFELDIRKLRGDADGKAYPFGVLVRADETGLNSYELGLTTSGKFRLARRSEGQGKAFVDWEKSPLIEEGGRAWNSIKVVSKGDLISFYANGEHLVNIKTVAEGTYKRGRVGVFAVDGQGALRDMVEFCEFVLTTP